jgi:hypothetical protein
MALARGEATQTIELNQFMVLAAATTLGVEIKLDDRTRRIAALQDDRLTLCCRSPKSSKNRGQTAPCDGTT